MTTYTPAILDIPTGLDEAGYKLGLRRLTHETSSDYRLRLLGFSRDLPKPDTSWFRRQASNLLGLISWNVLDIDLELDGSGVPTATDPRVEVTATKLLLWDDYAGESLALECDLVGEHRFLIDLHSAIDALPSYFTVGPLPTEVNYYQSKALRVSNSDGWSEPEGLSRKKVHKFEHGYVVDIYPEVTGGFLVEEAALVDVDETGDYYLDRVNGVVYNYEPMGGRCRYSFWDFPFRVWHDPVRVLTLVDTDIDQLTETQVRGELGLDIPGGLPTGYGARLYNELLGVYPLEWGE